MSCEPAIRLRGVSKAYKVFDRPEDRLKQMLWHGRKKYYTEAWALREMDFEVARGEVVGIVGRNGAGKSTLLEVICGTVAPTTGTVEVDGRIAALLELGSGFNPEFTGRQNVRLNASILGLDPAKTELKIPEIEAFADIGAYIDQPVRTYSSGMQARLAFATAISVEPSILVIDEALAVGDEAFQRKCYAHIHGLKENGTTILFVSHSAGSVIELCDRAILLDRGERLITGEPKIVVTRYQRLAYAPEDKIAEVRAEIVELDRLGASSVAGAEFGAEPTGVPTDRADEPGGAVENGPAVEVNGAVIGDADVGEPDAQSAEVGDGFEGGMCEGLLYDGAGDDVQEVVDGYDENLIAKSMSEWVPRGARIVNARIVNAAGERVNILTPRRVYRFEYDVEFDEICFGVNRCMLIKSVSGVELGGMMSHPLTGGTEIIEAGEKITATFRFRAVMNAGTYFLNAGLLANIEGERTYLHRIVDVLMFRIDPVAEAKATGYVDLRERLDRSTAMRRLEATR